MSLDALIAPLTLLSGLLLGAAWEIELRARPPRPRARRPPVATLAAPPRPAPPR